MIKNGLGFLLLLLANFTIGQTIPIIPKPQQVKLQEGTFDFSNGFRIQFEQEENTLKGISEILQRLQPIATKKREARQPIIWLALSQKNQKIENYLIRKNLSTNNLGKEGYYLIVQPDSIILAANAEAGLLYGLQSLQQLFDYYYPKKALPCLQITDFPAFKYRAVMDDISRSPLSNMNFLKAQIRRLAALKINVFTFYIEHVVKTKSHLAFAPNDGIKIEEFKALSAYAKEWNIELIGSFQSLGHFRNVLNAPEYRPLGATDRMLKPAEPQSLQFLKEVYAEMLPAFSSNFFNINADEAWDLVRGDLQPLADSLGAGQLYANHVVPLLNFLLKNGKKPMLWGDMLLAYPDAFEYLPKTSTVLTWEYSAYDSFSDWIDPIKNRGFDFWICPGIVNSNKLMPDYEDTFINLKNFINEGYEKGATGIMTTVWDDGGGHFFAKDWYGIAYAAEQSWHPNKADFSEFEKRFSTTFYKDNKNQFPSAVRILNELKVLSSTQKLQFSFLEEQLLPDFGEAHRLNVKDLKTISEKAKKTQQLFQALESKSVTHFTKTDWQKDLQYWQFFTRHLLAITSTYSTILEVAQSYKLQQQSHPIQSAESQAELRALTAKVQDLFNQWTLLKADYLQLWFQENRIVFFAGSNECF